MNEMRKYESTKFIENILVFLVLLIILLVLVSSLRKMVDKSNKSSAEVNTKTVMESVKNLYSQINLIDEANVPFKVVFEKDGYKVYSDGEEYKPTLAVGIKIDGKLPTKGTVTLEKDSKIYIEDLVFNKYTCNLDMKKTTTPICVKNKE